MSLDPETSLPVGRQVQDDAMQLFVPVIIASHCEACKAWQSFMIDCFVASALLAMTTNGYYMSVYLFAVILASSFVTPASSSVIPA